MVVASRENETDPGEIAIAAEGDAIVADLEETAAEDVDLDRDPAGVLEGEGNAKMQRM